MCAPGVEQTQPQEKGREREATTTSIARRGLHGTRHPFSDASGHFHCFPGRTLKEDGLQQKFFRGCRCVEVLVVTGEVCGSVLADAAAGEAREFRGSSFHLKRAPKSP